jgi:membrane protein implicated in regulation of membrane protease activity
MDMKKALYIILLGVEAASLFFPLFFILYLNGLLVSVIAFLAIAAVYAFLVIRAFKQKKSEDEAGLKKSKIIIALVCPAIWVAFIAYFFYVCTALGVI